MIRFLRRLLFRSGHLKGTMIPVKVMMLSEDVNKPARPVLLSRWDDWLSDNNIEYLVGSTTVLVKHRSGLDLPETKHHIAFFRKEDAALFILFFADDPFIG